MARVLKYTINLKERDMLNVGDRAPDFCLVNQDEVEICLRDLDGKWVVLYFYPKDNTPGCTKEAIDFTLELDNFKSLGAVVLGISADSPATHTKFIAKQNLAVTLLSDEDHSMMKLYGVYRLKKNYGKEYMGIVRTTIIITPDQEIAKIFNSVKVRTKRTKNGEKYEVKHVDIVRETLEELRGS